MNAHQVTPWGGFEALLAVRELSQYLSLGDREILFPSFSFTLGISVTP